MGSMKDLLGSGEYTLPVQPSPQRARDARNSGMSEVESKNAEWREKALRHLRSLGVGSERTGEEFRLDTESVIGKCPHPNLWGAIIAYAVRDTFLVATGEYRAMQGEKSHARKTPVYRRA